MPLKPVMAKRVFRFKALRFSGYAKVLEQALFDIRCVEAVVGEHGAMATGFRHLKREGFARLQRSDAGNTHG
jgi:hypothetical protein